MAITGINSISERIEKVAELVHKKLNADKAPMIEQFVRTFYDNVPPDDLRGETADNLFGSSLALWGQLQQRSPGEPKIRVYNPRPEEHGWKSSHTVIEVINDDMPFLVDSVTAALERLEVEVHLVIHPVISCLRDGKGKLIAVNGNGGGAGQLTESVMHIEISEQVLESHSQIAHELADVFADVKAAVEDWQTMVEKLQVVTDEMQKSPPAVSKGEISESIAFLDWLKQDNFTFLGYREYQFDGTGTEATLKVAPNSLGVLRDINVHVFDGLRDFGSLPAEVRSFMTQPVLIRITKANRRSTVHRSVHLDTVAVKQFDKNGKVIGEILFAGLFTSTAYARSPSDIPLLRHKVKKVLDRSGFKSASHDSKALSHILETFPRDELFQISEDELFSTSLGILHLQERRRIAIFVRKDPFERFISCLTYIPRDRFDTALRRKVSDILCQAYDGQISAFFTHLSDTALARVHFIIKTTRGQVPVVDVQELEQQVAEAGRSWADRLEEALVEARGEEQGIRAMRRFGASFPVNYQEHFNENDAVFDLSRAEEALAGDGLAMNLYRPLGADPDQIRFKIYLKDNPVPLSDVLPMLENMGLKVLSEIPYNFHSKATGESVWMHDFNMVLAGELEVSVSSVREGFHEAFAAVWHGRMENDGFNRLVLLAALKVREVTILRAYCKYLLQARIPFSQSYMEQTLAQNPDLTRLLVDLFLVRFAGKGDEGKATAINQEINGLLDNVSNLDEDRIIRRFRNVIDCTLRTNFLQKSEDGKYKSYLSFKLDSRKIIDLPLPNPFREIFVYSPEVEGIHLRFGSVARGGLRWSDRREDFRTEVLGLVKAQQVKNSVIVPVGSKGGFVVKNPPPASAGREAFLESGIGCYKTFIRGLLDITDNLVAGEVVPPVDVVRRDSDDPYLVVAADKGTATFSDIANSVSVDYGFWLDDAFASGGSAGYDHKKMGITAKGAWESVKRHFRELGKDIQKEPFSVVGVGDMSGDVFGNGMLLSTQIKLVGAFNHMHIFVDPEPDVAKSFAERQRLFNLPRSAWTDYDAKLISQGGGVFERSAKSIKISKEMKSLFEISEDELAPMDLMRAMLKSKAELLWFGGIGTYIKQSGESHADAGDRANDALRINAKQLRCKVVGEGANLGMTHPARVEFAQNGGLINTDFLDNSAGVDCSDHEVNIKILLGAVEAEGDITRKQRDKLLESMTDEVGELVLRDNYLQSQAISVTANIGGRLLDRIARYMRSLEKQGLLNRAIEFLPDDEMVLERMKQGTGFERPELATLMSYSKIALYDELLSSNLPDDPYMEGPLVDYFPTALRKKYAKQIGLHRLRREIIATVITNDMVNRVGITFVYEVKEKTGLASCDIARAYTIAREVFGMRQLFDMIEDLDNKAPASLQSSLLAECGRLIEQGTVWFLRNGTHPLDINQEIASYASEVEVIAKQLEKLVSKDNASLLASQIKNYVKQGVPADIAKQIAGLRLLTPACDIVRLAQRLKMPVDKVGSTYFSIGERYGFDWLRGAAGRLPSESAWDKLAVTAIVDDLFGHQGELTARVLEAAGKVDRVEAAIKEWAESKKPLVNRTEQILAELNAAGKPDYAMLAVANRQLKNMVSA
ncbi:NAD-glutamate dehydrogenase [Kiloniella laminariae]|uniref:NAD-glutamate dehydrogenase n=1 Tax=Kiloniella laminariae TaxID=454162 RepID=A0ABT4LJ42_9PROT|nr:NAD-glutamate dehydrogenase [Kiloniella laminariae]MCZ4281125.1 NAD-glutamate dehydrogenase [Kiloniella laminariae]